jgi:ATP-binding cassette subfamily B protein
MNNLTLMTLWCYFSKRRKKQFWMLLILMILASFVDVISISAVLPFLGALTSPEQVYQHSLAQPFVQMLGISNSSQLLLPLTVLFIAAAILAGLVRLLVLYITTKLSYATGADLSINIYRRTLYQEYAVHVSRNSSETINSIITKTTIVVNGIISPALALINSVIFTIAIISALFVIDTMVALTASVGFGGLYWIVIRYTKQQLQENGQCIAEQSTQMLKSLQEGLGGVRDVLIDNSQEFYCNIYRNADLKLRQASGKNAFISGSPRFIMEMLGIVLISGLAYSMSLREDGLATAIPILGALALGAQRLLPALQQSYASYSSIKGAHPSFKDVLALLEQPLPEYVGQTLASPIPFEKEIQLKGLGFSYNKDTPSVFNNINLIIPKGASIGFMGKTGSGKSTLLDVIMGLLKATQGEFLVDGELITIKNRRAWQARIAHVPQNIFLFDSSIAENVAFGIAKEEINLIQVKKACDQAQISESIENTIDGYQTLIGERGIRLSGGQRQRIGIARALYKRADVLIFDEATSALDNETEHAVMESIKGFKKGLTILIIAHRLSTLKDCDQVVQIEENGTINVGSYQDIVNI